MVFFFPRETNEENGKNRLVPKNPERPAQLNKVAPKHYVYRDKRFAWNQKESILLCAMLVICTIT